MKQANHSMHDGDDLRRSDSPSAAQSPVVQLAAAYAGRSVDRIDRFQHIVHVQYIGMPVTALLMDGVLERPRRSPMPAAGIEICKNDSLHNSPLELFNATRVTIAWQSCFGFQVMLLR